MHGTSRPASYHLLRPLAQGGMADVFLAARGDRTVALKIPSAARGRDAEARAMFLDEARVGMLLDHPNIAAVVDVARDFLAMEYVDGADLRQLLAAATRAGRAIPLAAALAIAQGAAAGLEHAHGRRGPDGVPLRIVHRDVSLSNIMVSHAGDVKVVDFGIAQTALQTVHTAPGIVRGKASYMSPEQCLGEPVDHRTDVFALGVVLYELTTGARCFHGKTDFDRMLAVVRGDYLAPSAIVARYPPALETIVRAALATDPAARPASAAALGAALARIARAHGWLDGRAAIVETMREVFAAGRPGDEREPEPTTTEVVDVARAWPQLGHGEPHTPTLRGRPLVHGVAERVDEDAPTRGRRAVPRQPCVLAA